MSATTYFYTQTPCPPSGASLPFEPHWDCNQRAALSPAAGNGLYELINAQAFRSELIETKLYSRQITLPQASRLSSLNEAVVTGCFLNFFGTMQTENMHHPLLLIIQNVCFNPV